MWQRGAANAGRFFISAFVDLYGLSDRPDNQGVYLQPYVNDRPIVPRAYSNDIINGHQLPNLLYCGLVYLFAGQTIDVRTSSLNPESTIAVDSNSSLTIVGR